MSSSPPGALLRQWRTRRRFSQLDLALAADVSTKHLSYVETGRATPSPEMVLHLCEHLDVPLKRRNEILLAAGHAPRYGHTVYDPSVDSEVRTTIDRLIAAHHDPTIAVDGDWNLIATNPGADVFLHGVAPHLVAPPTNVIRMSLHPDGLAPRIENFDDYAAHVLARVCRATATSPSAALDRLLDEFGHLAARPTRSSPDIFLTLDLRTVAGVVRFFSTITVFGSPRDVALDELALETFHPADPVSRANLDAALRTSGTMN